MPKKYRAYCLALENTRSDSSGDDDENDEKGDGDYFYDYVSSPFFIYVNKHRIDLKILLRLLMYFELDLILN